MTFIEIYLAGALATILLYAVACLQDSDNFYEMEVKYILLLLVLIFFSVLGFCILLLGIVGSFVEKNKDVKPFIRWKPKQ